MLANIIGGGLVIFLALFVLFSIEPFIMIFIPILSIIISILGLTCLFDKILHKDWYYSLKKINNLFFKNKIQFGERGCKNE